MRILSFGNVGNFQTGYKDGIVVLTRLCGLLTTSVSQVSYDLQMKTWHNSSTLQKFPDASLSMAYKREAPPTLGKRIDGAKVYWN